MACLTKLNLMGTKFRYLIISSALIFALSPSKAAVNSSTETDKNIEKAETDYDFVHSGIYYKILGGDSISTTKGNTPYSGNIVIPDYVGYGSRTYRVAKVGGFQGSALKSIILPSKLKTIDDEAFRNCTSLNSVTFPEKLVSIGNYAFFSCSDLSSVTIPDKVETIGNQAFAYCKKLNSVTLSEKLDSIGNSAFMSCNSLSKIVIPDNVKYIGDEAFAYCENLSSAIIGESVEYLGGFKGCSSLTTINIPNSVKRIASHAFYGVTQLTAINISSIDAWAQIDFSDCTANPMFYNPNALTINGKKYITNVILSDSVTKIGSFAFCGLNTMMSITIPETVTHIGDGAFTNCPQLYTLNVNARNFTSGEGLFYTHTYPCSNYGVHRIEEYNESVRYVNFGDKVSTIPDFFLDGCHNIKTLTIPESVTTIGKCACSQGIKTLYFNAINCTSVGNGTPSGFYYGFPPTLTKVVFGDKVKNIPANLLYRCDKIDRITISKSVTSIDCRAFTYCHADTVSYNAEDCRLTNTSEYSPFASPKALLIGDGVTSIPDKAFASCANIAEISLPESLKSIGDSAFINCTSLKQINYLTINAESIAATAFSGCDISTILISDRVKSLPTNAFSSCKSISTINCRAPEPPATTADFVPDYSATLTVPIGKAEIYKKTASWSKFSNIEETDTQGHIEINGLYYNLRDNKTAEITYQYLNDHKNYTLLEESAVTIPETVTFLDTEYTVTSIDDYAFFLAYISSIKLSNFITKIGKGALSNSRFTEITLPNSLRYIADNAFESCYHLTEISIPNSVDSIGEYAFGSCDALTKVTIPVDIKLIGREAFRYTSLSDVYYNAKDCKIGKYIFRRNTGNDSTDTATPLTIHIGDSTRVIKDAFNYEGSITTVELSAPVDSIVNSFNFCDKLSKITISGGTKKLKDSFNDCKNIKDVYFNADSCIVDAFRINLPADMKLAKLHLHIGEGVVTIPEGFRLGHLSSIDIPSTLTKIGAKVFIGSRKLESINISPSNSSFHFEDGVLYSADKSYVYLGLSTAESVAIPESVTQIRNWAFSNAKLKSISIPNSIKSIGYGTFYDCESLVLVELPQGLQEISNNAFSGCTSLKNINLPGSISYIGWDVFKDCSSLESIVWPTRCNTALGSFINCTNLRKVEFKNTIQTLWYTPFDGCNNIDTLICRASTPPTLQIGGIDVTKCKVFVPESSLQAYKSDKTWGTFTNIEGIQPDRVKVGDLYYLLNDDNTATVTYETTYSGNYSQLGSTITVPATITCDSTDYIVTQIGEMAFVRAQKSDIYLPETILFIDSKALLYGTKSVHCAAPLPPLTAIDIDNSSTTTLYVDYEYLGDYYESAIFDKFFAIVGEDTQSRTTVDHNGLSFKLLKKCRQAVVVADNNSRQSFPSSLTIPEYITDNGELYTVTHISDGLFENCEDLRSVTLPDSLKYLGTRTFKNCINLDEVSIPESLSRIPPQTFDGCQKLQSITIPSSVTRIGESTFANCPSLSTIYCLPLDPPYAYDIIESQRCPDVTVYVDDYHIDDYQSSSWRYFNIKGASSSGIADGITNDTSEITVVIKNGILTINGIDPQTPIGIYATDGRCIYNGPYAQIEALPCGCCVIRILDKAFKFKI